MTEDRRAKDAGLDHLKGEDRAALDAGTALAGALAAALPRDHHMYEEPVLAWRPEPGR
ncbi:MAG: hypothetical protein OXF26_00250 [Alphaproteobacteria bacterium]|nr:hypothetical protein [Alphaproteobacteria bacterium]MCY4229324.1 hypothetical protein [Alphaproteobacteria bacterium]MCY4318079.1 hypothetical protein [Alphaproteobacteria bacterium]